MRVQCTRSATIWVSGRSRNPYFVVLWASLLFRSRFRCIGDMAFFYVHPVSHISIFLHTFFPHFHHIYSFSRVIDIVIHFQGACYRTTYFPPHFSGPFSPWILVLGIGCSIPAPMACGLGRLKMDSSTWNTTKMVESGESAMQEGVHLLCHPKFRFATSLPSISSAPQSSSPPKAPSPSPLPQELGRSPSRSPLVWVA